MIQSVLFDLDDTLYCERQFVEGGFQAVASHISQRYNLNAGKVYALLLDVLDRQGRGFVFDISLKELNLYDENIISELVDIYRSHRPQLTLFPEVDRVLETLKRKGCKLGLITDGKAAVQESKVKALGIEGLFDCLVFSDKYGVGCAKPAAFAYYKALEKLETPVGQSAYVGDNPYKDFVSAKKIGMLTVRTMRGRYKMIELEREYEADFRISTLNEIFEILNGV